MRDLWYNKFKTKPEHKESDISIRIGVLCASEAISESTRGFLHSLQEQYNRNGGLTERQYEALKETEEYITPEAIKRHNEWAKNFDEDKRKSLLICAKYYKDSNYFFEMSARALGDPDYIPMESAYKSMCENQYATRVVEATISEPKFENGTVVTLRKNSRSIDHFSLGELAVVIRSGHLPVIIAAKGAKRYDVLPFGSDKIVVIEERYLKKGIDKKKKV
jgi:hypothetical protein|tara:strand:- start:2454 stop:3113 length:660 start_codon:yes stop_codon:yes gene_type:complete